MKALLLIKEIDNYIDENFVKQYVFHIHETQSVINCTSIASSSFSVENMRITI
jgi:hypothetical protein